MRFIYINIKIFYSMIIYQKIIRVFNTKYQILAAIFNADLTIIKSY